jgi:cupin superfamily acireductone dioxygenase involved in methionine salvage
VDSECTSSSESEIEFSETQESLFQPEPRAPPMVEGKILSAELVQLIKSEMNEVATPAQFFTFDGPRVENEVIEFAEVRLKLLEQKYHSKELVRFVLYSTISF